MPVMSRLKGLKTRPVKEPDTLIYCRACGMRSQVHGDRFMEFMWVHWESCGHGHQNVHSLFDWVKRNMVNEPLI